MAILITSLVSACDTNVQGDVVRNAIIDALKSDEKVVLDFAGVANVTSSFVNSALIALLPDYDIETIKSRIVIKRVNRQIGNMINRRFQYEARA